MGRSCSKKILILIENKGFGVYSMMGRSAFHIMLWNVNTSSCVFIIWRNLSFFSCACLEECNAAIHKKCIDKIIGRCTGTAANSRDTMVRAGTTHLECNYVVKCSWTKKILYRNGQVHSGTALTIQPSYCLLWRLHETCSGWKFQARIVKRGWVVFDGQILSLLNEGCLNWSIQDKTVAAL